MPVDGRQRYSTIVRYRQDLRGGDGQTGFDHVLVVGHKIGSPRRSDHFYVPIASGDNRPTLRPIAEQLAAAKSWADARQATIADGIDRYDLALFWLQHPPAIIVTDRPRLLGVGIGDRPSSKPRRFTGNWFLG